MQWLPPPEFATNTEAWRVAAMLSVVPVLFGLPLGYVVRRWHHVLRGWGPVRFSVAALPMWIAVGVASWPWPVGAWDLLWVGALTTLAVLLGDAIAAKGRRRVAGGLLLSVTVFGAAEAAARLSGVGAREWPEPRQAHLIKTAAAHSIGNCSLAFPLPEELQVLASTKSEPARTVLHIGDSMLSWEFEAGLAQDHPEAAHVVAAVAGAGPEGYARAIDNWLQARPASEVFVYLFVGNDVHGMFDRNVCCKSMPLFDVVDGVVRSNCERAKYAFSLRDQISESAAPFALRVAGSCSHLARAGVEGSARLSRLFDPPVPLHGEPSFRKLDAMLGWMKARTAAHGARLHVVVLPFRKTLELSVGLPTSPDSWWGGLDPGLAAHRRLIAMAEGRGIDTLDAWSAMRGAVEALGAGAFTPSESGTDVHFAGDGMRHLTRWLAAELRARGIGADPPSGAQP